MKPEGKRGWRTPEAIFSLTPSVHLQNEITGRVILLFPQYSHLKQDFQQLVDFFFKSPKESIVLAIPDHQRDKVISRKQTYLYIIMLDKVFGFNFSAFKLVYNISFFGYIYVILSTAYP